MAKAIYGDVEIDLPVGGATIEQARASIAVFYSEVEEAEGRIDEETGDIIFEVKAGVKGATRGKAIYGDVEIDLPEGGATIEQARASIAVFYSEVEEAEGRIDEETGNIIFEVKAGVKG